MLGTLWLVLPLAILTFLFFGLYRGMWRFASLPDLRRILLAVGLSALLIPTSLYMTHRMSMTPRAVLVLFPLMLILLMGGSRFLYRAFKDGMLVKSHSNEISKVIVLGAGSAASILLRDTHGRSGLKVVGLLDDDLHKKGRHLYGVPVLGPLTEIAKHAKDLEATQAIIAMPSTSASVRRRAMQLAKSAGLSVLSVPGFDDLLSGKVAISQIRKVELVDLLGRDSVSLDLDDLNSLLANKVVMVTGAGGSIGSELCRQIAGFNPRQLVLFEANEFALYRMEQEFLERYNEVPVICAVGDVKNPQRVAQIMADYNPAMIFHAAAYKHVPLMEKVNVWEAVRNNVYGTYVVAQAAITQGAEKFVLISTDKAVNPTNVMGASKRLAEMVCQALHQSSPTQFEMVRFGNVLGSTGSVIPKFREQIARGGPVTVTHPDIIRYFMSIPEAAQLVLQAAAMGRGGEIFVLDMGEPIKIANLARNLIRLSGFTEDEIKIEYTGLRSGEKMHEELLADDEKTERTPHPKLRIAKAREVELGWLDNLLIWLNAESVPKDETVRQALQSWVPEYEPTPAQTEGSLPE